MNAKMIYVRWDLCRVHLVDHRIGAALTPIYLLDQRANAGQQRLLFELVMSDVPANDGQQISISPDILLRENQTFSCGAAATGQDHQERLASWGGPKNTASEGCSRGSGDCGR